jgi:hypothetical protein
VILYENLFERSDERKVTDWLLASLLQAEEDGSLHKRSVLSGNGFFGKLVRISEELPEGHQEFGAGTWNLIGIAFQNSQLISAEICNRLVTSFAAAVGASAEKIGAKLIQFLNDAFLFWDENVDLSTEMISSEGGRQLVLELFKASCKRRDIFRVDLTSLWLQGLKTIIAKDNEDKNEILSKVFSHIRKSLESNANDDEQIFQSFSLLNLLRAGKDSKDYWQNCWLEMMPKLKRDGTGISEDIENSLLFSIKNQVELTVLNLRNPLKQNSSAKNRKKAAEFFLRTAKLLLGSGVKIDMVPALLDVLVLAVTIQCSAVDPEEELRLTLQKIVQESLTSESKESLKEIAFKNSKSFGWEWSLALHKILTWFKDDPELKNLIKVTDLSPESTYWSEPELHTLQVLIKFSSRTELRDLAQTEVGCVLSLEKNDDKNRISISLVLLVSALKHLDLENEIELKESLKSILDLVAFWRQAREEDFLYAVNVAEKSWSDVVFVTSICRLLQVAVEVLSVDENVNLESSHWDLILCSLSSWIQSVDESASVLKKASFSGSGSNSGNPESEKSKEVTAFAVAAIQLASVVTKVLDRFEMFFIYFVSNEIKMVLVFPETF